MSNPPATCSGDATLPRPRHKTWFDRNWKWMIPVLLVVLILGIAAFVGIILSIVEGSIHGSYPYKYAVQKATESAEVAARIGSPVKLGWLTTGRISVQNDDGAAFFRIPLTGVRAGGTIIVEAKKRAGEWTFQTLQVVVDGEAQPIELEGGQPLRDAAHPAKST